MTKSSRSHDFRIQDLWRAAQAIERKFTLLTANTKEFADVAGSQVLALNALG